jgi:hypothetical protein
VDPAPLEHSRAAQADIDETRGHVHGGGGRCQNMRSLNRFHVGPRAHTERIRRGPQIQAGARAVQTKASRAPRSRGSPDGLHARPVASAGDNVHIVTTNIDESWTLPSMNRFAWQLPWSLSAPPGLEASASTSALIVCSALGATVSAPLVQLGSVRPDRPGHALTGEGVQGVRAALRVTDQIFRPNLCSDRGTLSPARAQTG